MLRQTKIDFKWHSVHGDHAVIGLVPTAVAAGVLGDGICVDTDNVAKWIFESVGEGAARRAERDVLSSILIASDNETVAELNQRAHTDLVESGDVDITEQVVLRAEVQAGVGDVLLARRNDRSIRDSNGSQRDRIRSDENCQRLISMDPCVELPP